MISPDLQSANPARCAVIYDPIFRGSRLTSSAHAARTLKSLGYDVDILTRTIQDSSHYLEVFKGIDHRLIASIPYSNDVWFGRVSFRSVRKALCEIAKRPYSVVFVTGWDENLPWLPLLLWFSWRRNVRSALWLLVDYSPELQLRNEFHSMPFSKRRLLFRTICECLFGIKLKRHQVFYADERVFSTRVKKVCYPWNRRFLPDPSPCDLSCALATTNASLKDIPQVLLVGRQDPRKGLSDLVDTLERTPILFERLQIKLIGSLTAGTEYLADRMERLVKKGLLWEKRYISEKEIIENFAKCDYVLLPYSSTFTGSSGVFSYAMAAGKPVITTEHGCIGYRVAFFGVGFSYRCKDTQKLAEILSALPSVGGATYQRMAARCYEFARNSDGVAFQNCLASCLDNINENTSY